MAIFSLQKMRAQSVEISGKVESKTDVENIHVINKTSKVFTITDKLGSFNITGKLQDTIVFSSIQHQPKEIVISKDIMFSKAIFVTLEEQINELDEVLVGKILSGDLLYDIKNTDGKPPINFYDVGIPGYTGRPATQSERRLSEASDFSPSLNGNSMGAGGAVSILPIINAITGRTKMLKARVDVEERQALMQSIMGRLAKDFFASNPISEDLRMDFFYFCADDENFLKACKNQTDFITFIFLKMKYNQYLENINSNKQ